MSIVGLLLVSLCWAVEPCVTAAEYLQEKGTGARITVASSLPMRFAFAPRLSPCLPAHG